MSRPNAALGPLGRAADREGNGRLSATSRPLATLAASATSRLSPTSLRTLEPPPSRPRPCGAPTRWSD